MVEVPVVAEGPKEKLPRVEAGGGAEEEAPWDRRYNGTGVSKSMSSPVIVDKLAKFK